MITNEDVEKVINAVVSGGSHSRCEDSVYSALEDIVSKEIKEDQLARMGALIDIGATGQMSLFDEPKGDA